MEPNLDLREVDYADSELRYNRFMAPAYRTALAALDLPRDRPSRGLDVGCGPGGLFALLDEATGGRADILGLDVSEPHLAEARRQIERHRLGDRVRVQPADLRRPFALGDDEFDWAVAADVLWGSLFARPAAVVAEMARVTRPGGTVAVWFFSSRGVTLPGHPDLDRYLALAHEQRWNPIADRSAHPERATAWLRATGLEEVRRSWHFVAGRAPLSDIETGYLDDYWLCELRSLSREELAGVGMGDDAWQRWRVLSDPTAASFALTDPDYHYFIPGALVVGRVPATRGATEVAGRAIGDSGGDPVSTPSVAIEGSR